MCAWVIHPGPHGILLVGLERPSIICLTELMHAIILPFSGRWWIGIRYLPHTYTTIFSLYSILPAAELDHATLVVTGMPIAGYNPKNCKNGVHRFERSNVKVGEVHEA